MEKKVSDYCLENIKDVESELNTAQMLNSARRFEDRNFPKMTLIANKIRELEALVESSLEDLKEKYQNALSEELKERKKFEKFLQTNIRTDVCNFVNCFGKTIFRAFWGISHDTDLTTFSRVVNLCKYHRGWRSDVYDGAEESEMLNKNNQWVTA